MCFSRISLILLVLGGLIGASYFVPSKIKIEDTNFGNSVNVKTPSNEHEITLFFVGDIMLNRGVEYIVNKYSGKNWKFPFSKIAEFLNKADILFGNLEGPISNQGRKVGSIYSFRMSPEVLEGLKFVGFDILSLANNHTLDYGIEALEQTMELLKENGIEYVGAGKDRKEAYSAKIIELKNTKIAFLAFTDLGVQTFSATDNKPGIAWIDDPLEPVRYIEQARKEANVVIVSFHTGQEYQSEPTPMQRILAQKAIEAGSNLVIQHHSHVIQPVEKYKQGWIAYGLGNFVFDQGFSEKTMQGLLLEIKIKNKALDKIFQHKIQLNEFFQPNLFGE